MLDLIKSRCYNEYRKLRNEVFKMTKRNRKDFEIEITYEQAEKLYGDLLKWSGDEFAGLMFEGSMLDEYAVVMTNNQNWKINMLIGRPILARKYVYI